MKTLYLDTSSSYLFLGICENQKKLGEVKLKLDKGLSSFTLPEMEQLFLTCQLEPKSIDKIIVVNGPGSFTGIRIGVTIAKMYAWALGTKITTISSLEAMASSSNGEYQYIVPMIDARRESVYGAIFDNQGNSVLPGQYIKKEALLLAMENLPGTSVVITNDVKDLSCAHMTYDANIECIVSRYENKQAENPHSVEPEYLKLTEAEESKQ